MPFAQPQQKLGAIRRQFSHLSSSSRPKCNLLPLSASKSVSPPLIDQTQKMVDDNQNQVNSPSAEFDLSANLEAYKKRCKALEMENARLMENVGKIIAESNRRIECHLKEIHCLKEQMDTQRRSNGELLRWAQSAEEESQRAKELSKEWQKFGQCNSQLMKKELHSHQHQMNQLEAKTAKLTTENLELKRLCLYLDEQRQAFWRELSSAGQTKSPSNRPNSAEQFAMGSGRSSSEDAGCCRSSVGTNSSAECMNIQTEDEVRGRKKVRKDGEDKVTKGTIRTDYEQEEVLQAICSELSNSMAFSVEQRNGINESVPSAGVSVCAQNILPNDNDQIESASSGNGCDSNRPLSYSTVTSSNGSSAECFAHFGGSGLRFSPMEDPTAVLVGHQFDEIGSERTSRVAEAEQSLKVHELCTISEEEDKREGIRHRLEILGREMEEHLDGVGSFSMVAEAGSMFTSLLHFVDQTPAKQRLELAADLVANHRISTGSSSTSSGAFSGISRCTDDDGEETEALEGRGRGGRQRDEAEDDLPPEMPLITPGECRFVRHSFREFPSDHRSSSSMALSARGQHQLILQPQSSTLPRTPFFAELQQNECANNQRTKTKTENTQKGKASQQMPVRIRVRPPPAQFLSKINGEHRTVTEKDGRSETHDGFLIGKTQRVGTTNNEAQIK
ncbi:hypothetical protein niasHT_013490 [Heterodera trifolii]|uniref:Uncharacterized protein n=1 Tax=Heterodera trifolii TaxID=157864 RepID=A0ABD2LCS6_9BILA